jgi:tetratricopeptide (TPR) repeat protein
MDMPPSRIGARSRLSRWGARGVARFYYLLSESHRYFGNRYNLKSEQEKAIQALDRAIAANPQYARAYMERGILYWREMDQPRRAILDLTLAYQLEPTLIEARFNRGIAHQQLREYAEAIADFEAYLAEGRHPYWREYAETMIRELKEWVPEPENGLPT